MSFEQAARAAKIAREPWFTGCRTRTCGTHSWPRRTSKVKGDTRALGTYMNDLIAPEKLAQWQRPEGTGSRQRYFTHHTLRLQHALHVIHGLVRALAAP